MIHEINRQDWPAFCLRITEQRAGSGVKLEVIESDGIKFERIANANLQSMMFDQTDACCDVITLRLRNEREINFEIIDPIRIRLYPSGTSGDFNPIQIEAENGITILTLHPSIHGQMLAGLIFH